MDWNLKAASWDFSQLEHEAYKNISTVGGSSSLGDLHGTNTGDFSVDLKLGQVGDTQNEFADKWKEPSVVKMESSPSGSSKRARGGNNGAQPVSCLVDGCNSDLSNCRDYHRRHKVCELHSKTPQVTIAGHKQRFCQQCSRFHSLEEFDEGKRSCRKRLDGHNRRRRKPQPEPMSRTGNILSHYQGSQLLSFANSQMHPSTTMVNHEWGGVANAEADARLQNHHNQQNIFLGPSPSSSTRSYKEGKLLTFLQGETPSFNHQTSLESSVCQPLLRTISFSDSSGDRNNNILYDRFTPPVRESDCALSLLSSPQPQPQSSGIGNSISLPPSLGVNLEPMDSVLVSNIGNAEISCPGMFHIGSEEAPPTLPFHWE